MLCDQSEQTEHFLAITVTALIKSEQNKVRV